jgi:NAD(P)-dependent dehydrogenase (short-subunit alcohol dehydrogenase family)
MPNTVLITGASSGVGEATAQLFARRGWNVVASARAVEQIAGWADQPNIARLAMDVTDEAGVQAAVTSAAARFGGLDALVNNAGAGLAGAFESISEADLKAVFEVNVFGAARTIRAAIPLLRMRKAGVIVNVTSITGRVGLPFMAPYDSTKFALEGLSESLSYELSTVGIRVRLVEPGGIKTAFSHKWIRNPLYPALDRLIDKMNVGATQAKGPEGVAEAIFRAANDRSSRLRYTANGSGPLILLNRLLPASVWRGMVVSNFLSAKAERR